MKSLLFCDTPVGRVGIADNGEAITNLFFGNMVTPSHWEERSTPLLEEAARQLSEYFGASRKIFDLPLSPEGTDFEKQVWNALLAIPYGQTKNYGQIAAQLCMPTASRAVGRANGLNPIGIIIPCHRVIGANGKLTGYAGGIAIKQKLLALEQGGVLF